MPRFHETILGPHCPGPGVNARPLPPVHSGETATTSGDSSMRQRRNFGHPAHDRDPGRGRGRHDGRPRLPTTGRTGRGPWLEKYALAHVSRTDLFPALTASGRVESSKRTLIECELENITIGIMGQRFTAGGASVLLSVVPEGSYVQQGRRPGGARLVGLRGAPPPAADDRRAVAGRPPPGAA